MTETFLSHIAKKLRRVKEPCCMSFMVSSHLHMDYLMLQEKVINDVLLADQPSKKFVRPEEIGALVRHLCSDDAQSFQGACISIDGGWTAR